jgi:two-component system, LytTR family, sensor kinase
MWRPSSIALVYGAWLLIAAIISTSVLLDNNGNAGNTIPWVRTTLTFIEASIWATSTLLMFWLTDRYPPERYGAWQRVGCYLLGGVIATLCVAVVMQWIRQTFSADDLNRPFAPVSPIGVAIEALTYAGALAAALARHYLRRLQYHRETALALEAQAVQLQAQLSEARLTVLRAQLNPHFLFNTLHAIAALTARDPALVRRMLARLSELLRISLDEIDDPEVPLRHELEFAGRYLELMQLQATAPLDIRQDIPDETLDALVPTLLLQPLIENAILHGLSQINSPGFLSLCAERNGDMLRVIITNNGPAHHAAFTEGVGLRNTRARLRQLYGETGQALHLTHDALSGEFRTEIELPFHVQPAMASINVAGDHATLIASP